MTRLRSTLILCASFGVGLLIPSEFSPPQDQSTFNVRVTAPLGSDVEEADRYARRIEEVLYARPEVTSVMANVSPGSASLTVNLVPPSERSLTQQALSAQLRSRLSMAGARISIQDPSQQGLWDEMTTFPVGEYDDLLDAAMSGTAYLLDRPEPRVW